MRDFTPFYERLKIYRVSEYQYRIAPSPIFGHGLAGRPSAWGWKPDQSHVTAEHVIFPFIISLHLKALLGLQEVRILARWIGTH